MTARPALGRLTDAAAATYPRRVLRLLRGARLNQQYPAGARLSSHLGALAPEVHRGLYPELELDGRSGWPSLREWTRVLADAEVARGALAELPTPEALAGRLGPEHDPVHARRLTRRHYYEALLDRPLFPLSTVEVALRRVWPAERTAQFHVTLDRLDGSGLFVRLALDLSQRASWWNRPLFELDRTHAAPTAELRDLVCRLAAFDPEFTFLQLAAQEGITVERVTRGAAGPVRLAEGLQAAPAFPPGLSDQGRSALAVLDQEVQRQGGGVAIFSLSQAACDLAADRNHDPLLEPWSASLSSDARAEQQRGRERLGYRVFHDCKFVASRELVPAVERLCRQAGTRNVIYGVEL